MCGIAALQLSDSTLRPRLGELMNSMLCEIIERGPDAAGISFYGDQTLSSPGSTTVSMLDVDIEPATLVDELKNTLGRSVGVQSFGATTLIRADASPDDVAAAVRSIAPSALEIGRGMGSATVKDIGAPLAIAEKFGLTARGGTQALSHTRMATESAVVASGSHPFAVDDDLSLVHNGSFSNHATIRRELIARGFTFDSDNDSEVAARFVGWRLSEGDDLGEALGHVLDRFDGFYTLVVMTGDSMAVLRDPIACKPAIIGEGDGWVAMASEYRALTKLPGIKDAKVFEPEPGRVYTWQL